MKKKLLLGFWAIISTLHISAQDQKLPDSLIHRPTPLNDIVFPDGMFYESSDVYTRNTLFPFNIASYRNRGYEPQNQVIQYNNIELRNLANGLSTYMHWDAFNHIMLDPAEMVNLSSSASDFSFGAVGGGLNFNLRASALPEQFRATYSLSNRTYTNRMMITGATGVSENGWSFAVSFSGQFGNQLGYIDGMVDNSWSYFAAVEKRFNPSHSLNLTFFGSPSWSSLREGVTKEVRDLLGKSYYNPNWGWYNGKQRNARMNNTYVPVILLTHDYTPEEKKYTITSSLEVNFGKNNTTALNWYQAEDPRPDSYQHLPSFQTIPEMRDLVEEGWLYKSAVRQIDWDKIYNINQLAANQGKRAQYITENHHKTHFQLGGSSHIMAELTEHMNLTAGIDLKGMKQRNFKTLDDLLGGSYWLDIENYPDGVLPDPEIAANDLDQLNKKIHKDDIFGYNYDYHIYDQNLWGLLAFTYNKLDFYAGLNLGATEFWREGKMKNGRYGETAEGKSDVKSFLNYGIKAGITYKINKAHALSLNGFFNTRAPYIVNAFLSPRLSNNYTQDLTSEKIISADLSYKINYSFMKLRLSGYYTKFIDQTRLISFYHDDYRSLMNYSLTGIDQQHVGIELGAEFKLSRMFTLFLAGNFGDYTYTNNPNLTMEVENGYDIPDSYDISYPQEVKWKNAHVTGSPQIAATLGLQFHHKGWWVMLNGNYFDKIYCDMNPFRRTSAVEDATTEEQYTHLSNQEKIKGQFTLDLSVSKSWHINKKYWIGFDASVTNLLNNKKLVTAGWEQYPYNLTGGITDRFQNRYIYAYGISFYAGINLRF